MEIGEDSGYHTAQVALEAEEERSKKWNELGFDLDIIWIGF